MVMTTLTVFLRSDARLLFISLLVWCSYYSRAAFISFISPGTSTGRLEKVRTNVTVTDASSTRSLTVRCQPWERLVQHKQS